MKVNEWSQENSDAFKTISSYSDTRNQTSNKKYFLSKSKKRKSKKKYDSDDIFHMKQSLYTCTYKDHTYKTKESSMPLEKNMKHFLKLKVKLRP